MINVSTWFEAKPWIEHALPECDIYFYQLTSIIHSTVFNFRVNNAKMDIKRYPSSIARYVKLKHRRDKGNPPNPLGYVDINTLQTIWGMLTLIPSEPSRICLSFTPSKPSQVCLSFTPSKPSQVCLSFTPSKPSWVCLSFTPSKPSRICLTSHPPSPLGYV